MNITQLPSGRYITESKGETADSRDCQSFEIRWESRKSNGNPGNPMEIQGIRWKSRESDGNPGNPVGIQGIRCESQEYLVDIYEYTGNVPVSHTQLMTFHLFTILKPIALSK
jgi:hypothetical protein